MARNKDGSRSITSPNRFSRVTCPNGGTLVPAQLTKLNGAAPKRRKKAASKTRSKARPEGVKADGTLKKGYKYLKGGRVVKVKKK